ncbi:MAG TPA: transcriptional regulator [Pseudonocardiaceae bacterium]|nr:transcriptional regulator [Pseudonocardiaceae bacterium]
MAEDSVVDNWSTVSVAIRLRMAELGMSQVLLVVRSGVSKCIVGELVVGRTFRHRSPRTLAAISEALEWHPAHLEFLQQGKIPPEPEQFVRRGSAEMDSWQSEIAARLANIERRIADLDRKLDKASSRRYSVPSRPS